MGFYSLSKVFSYRKHISSKRNIRVLTIFGKSRNVKIIIASSTAPPPPPLILWYSLNILWESFYYDPFPHFKIFFWNTHPPPPAYSTSPPAPLLPTVKHRRVIVPIKVVPAKLTLNRNLILHEKIARTKTRKLVNVTIVYHLM